MAEFLIYGANGYTGALIAEEAVARGLRPILAGRNRGAVETLGRQLGLEIRVFGLDDPAAIDHGVSGMTAVVHCAGPFLHTFRPMADACLRGGVHYLDITGEAAVFEALAEQSELARAAGVMLLPGAGFDVVPSDCLAVHLKNKLPTATHLTLAIQSLSRISRGTANTVAQNLGAGGLVRTNGKLRRVSAGFKTRTIDFGDGPVSAMTIPWGDLVTAYYSTGIPNIEVYMAAPWATRMGARISGLLAPLLQTSLVQGLLRNRIQAGPPGPSEKQRRERTSTIWGEAIDASGNRMEARIHGPEAYTLTARAAVAIVQRSLAGQAPPGFQTPATAYGPDFVLEITGVRRVG